MSELPDTEPNEAVQPVVGQPDTPWPSPLHVWNGDTWVLPSVADLTQVNAEEDEGEA